MFFALLLFYSMVMIYVVLRRNRMSDKINISAFIINSVLFLFQAVAFCLWYYNWYIYKKNFYDVNCNDAAVSD